MELVAVFIIGTLIGSFLNVTIFRVHDDRSVVKGRSKCMKCEEAIDVKDLVPVLSYLNLRGRCRKCKSVISWQYPVIEIVTGLLFVAAWMASGMGLMFVRDAIFVSYLIIIFVYDLRHMMILDKFTVPAMIIAVLLNLWLGYIPAWSILAGGLVLAGFFYIQFAISKGGWVGGGDIRMGALMGFMLGLEHGLVALFIAYLLGAVVSVGLMLFGKAGRKTPIPFGTFLTVSTVVVLFCGGGIVEWYLGLFGG
ncbi:prepilin peptidase [Candidatus Uhrbacteria bacterium]|jgi:prepilin signal peptidase PulO-like enzyme (type II secretory pathway)|nr:prepilin peptidase [Candidatus Uhrbacteria bacterium]